MVNIDLSQYSLDELSQVEALVRQERQKRREQQEESLYRDIREKISALGISPDDLVKRLGASGKGSRGKVAPQYRDPANPANTWTGRGRKPVWVQAWLDQGRSIDELRIA